MTKLQNYSMVGTKLEIFTVAIELFSTRGYDNVGIREIAAAVGIKSSSIYNHFSDKSDLLGHILGYFSETCLSGEQPDMEEVLQMIPDSAPHEVLDEVLLPLNAKETYDVNRRIIAIALSKCGDDARANAVVSQIFRIIDGRLRVVIEKMLELDVIEPIDIDLFMLVFVRFGLSQSMGFGTKHALSFAKWQKGRKMLYGLVREKKRDSYSR